MHGNLKRVSAICVAFAALAVLAVLALQCDSRSQKPAQTGVATAPIHVPRPCNVLLVVVDTLRANRLSCYCYPRPTSPNTDRLAARGTLYRNNHSQSSWTLTSMISMMT